MVYNDGNLQGKVEMELEILTEAEAIEKPAGKGREEPNPLDPPQYVFSLPFSIVWLH